MVPKADPPLPSVPMRPKPRNDEFGSARVSLGSLNRPCASACQISSMQSGTGCPSPSNTLPSIRMRSPELSDVIRLLLKASFQAYWPFGVSPYLKNGPTVCDGVMPGGLL